MRRILGMNAANRRSSAVAAANAAVAAAAAAAAGAEGGGAQHPDSVAGSARASTPPPPVVKQDSGRTLMSMLGFGRAPVIEKTDHRAPELQKQAGLGRALFRAMMGSSANLRHAEAQAAVVEVKKEVKIVDEKGEKHVNHYKMLEVIGRGATGKVRRCIDEETGVVMAAKIIRKSRLLKKRVGRFGNALQDVMREIAVWKKLSHPHITHLKEVIDDAASDKLYMVGEYVNGGALMPDEKAVQALPLDKARRYFCMLIDGIYYLHFNNVVHRDIKPGNLLLDRETDIVKIADFGVSQAFSDNDSFRSTAGTAAFLAPEMLTGQQFSGRQQDVWACGVTLYMFIYGCTPFYDDTVAGTYENIKRGQIPWRTRTALGAPLDLAALADANDLIAHLLDPDPETRFTLEMARAHRFLAASGINFRPLPREAVTVSDAEVAGAVGSVVKLRALIKAAVIGKRSLNAARMRLALRRAQAAAAFARSGDLLNASKADADADAAAMMDNSAEGDDGASAEARAAAASRGDSEFSAGSRASGSPNPALSTSAPAILQSRGAHAHTQSFVQRNFTGLGDSPAAAETASVESSDTNYDLSDRSDGGDSQAGGSRPTSGGGDEAAAAAGGGGLQRTDTSTLAEYRLTATHYEPRAA
jgi:[calcium/calmodulin-dependent protein kinase] kinase